MEKTKRRFLRLCGTVIGGISLAGCSGGDDDEEETPTPTPEDEETPTPTPEDEETPTPTPEDEETPTPTPEDEETPTPTPEDEETPTPEPEPAFGIAQINADETVLPSDETFSIDLFLENTGGADGVATIEVSMGPLATSEESEEISAGESVPVTTELEVGALDRGRYEVTAVVGDDSDSVLVDVFANTDGSGVYGSVISEAGTSLSGNNLQVYGLKEGEFEIVQTAVDDAEQFYAAHPFDPEYFLNGLPMFGEYGVFNGVPAVFNFKRKIGTGPERISVSSDVEILGRIVVPEAYRTEVQLVDATGEPLADFTPINFRGPEGTAPGPNAFTTDGDGYVIASEGDETGITVPTLEDGGYQVVARPESGEEVSFGNIYGSPEGEEFTFEVGNPDRFE